MTLRARYDGYADWYDGWNKPHAERNAPEISELLGPAMASVSTWAAAAGITST